MHFGCTSESPARIIERERDEKKSHRLFEKKIKNKNTCMHKFIYSVKWNANELNEKWCG